MSSERTSSINNLQPQETNVSRSVSSPWACSALDREASKHLDSSARLVYDRLYELIGILEILSRSAGKLGALASHCEGVLTDQASRLGQLRRDLALVSVQVTPELLEQHPCLLARAGARLEQVVR